MPTRARDGTCLAGLVKMAIVVCRAAQRHCTRTGSGRPPTFEDWQIAVLILIAVLNRRKSKSAQYRFLNERRTAIQSWLLLAEFPTRSTYFLRYRAARRLLEKAVWVQGMQALGEGIADPTSVAVDKSLIAARGPVHHRHRGRPCKPSRGVDLQAGWGYSEHDGWVYGYGFETVVTATRNSLVFPLLASVDPANKSEHSTLGPKIPLLPPKTRNVLADRGYDSNAHQEAIEFDPKGKRTGRRFACPLIARAGKPKAGRFPHKGRRGLECRHRHERLKFMESPKGRRIYKRRSKSVEPFHEWFKSCFELNDRVWHRGLDNNQTQVLAALVAYQLLVRYNHRCGRTNGQIQWLLDCI
jgi:hypothetical protein